ncbi:MAG TPA: hypothetical protein VFO65_13930, partial [Acidimicrobiales bacterium]|nr:hypothetical protein [Acidimicrobiales bacterium]
MNPSAVLSPEIVDLGLALGLLTGSGGSVSFDSDWFSDPGSKAATALADDDRRAALVRFVDAVNGEGGAAESGGVTFLKVFAAADLGTAGAPDLTVSVSIDDRPSTYVEVGVAVEHATTAPATRTRLVVPLYRTGKSTGGGPVAAVAEPFALAAGSPIRLSSSIATDGGPADPSGFRLDAVEVAAEVPVAGGDPSVELALLGLRLPGATAPTDIRIGGSDSDVEEALLSLVLGVVRAGASALGPAGATVMAALDLIGLGPDALVPALDVDDLVRHGASAFRTWFAATMATAAPRAAWLGALADVVGGTVQDGRLVVDLGPVDLTLEMVARPGADGHLEVTPRIGLELAGLLGAGPGAVRLGVAAVVDVLTVDVVDGGLTAVPKAELLVSLAGDGARLLPTGPVRIGGVQVGLGFDAGDLVPVLRALDVQVGSDPPHAVVDLSSADAVVAAAGQLAGQLVGAALDALGDTGAHLKALLGLTPPAGVDPLDAAVLLTDPLAALRDWWQGLLGDPDPAKARAVLDHVVALLGQNPAAGTTGVGTAAAPYSIPVLQSPAFSLDVWRDGSTLVVAPTLSKRFSDLAGGCTLVVTTVRAELAAVDLATGQLSLLRSAELSIAFRGRGSTEARLALGPVALVAQRIGFAARWSAAAGFRFGLDAPGLAADLGTATVPLELPTGAGWQAAALTDVENLVGVLGVTNPSGWLHDLVDLLGWTFGAEAHPHRLGLAALVADPGAELARWGRALLTDEVLVGRVASTLARLLTGSTTGRAGILDGRGTPSDPWVLPLGTGAGAPALSLAIGPDGPRIAPSTTTDALRTWRPGRPGLAPGGLARAVLDEGLAGDDTAALARGRGQLGTGLEALVVRVTGTDVMVAPPPPSSPVAGVAVSTHPSMLWTAWPGLATEVALKGPVPAGAAVVRVAVGTAASHPWTDAPAGRLVDLSAPGLAPESFTVTAPDGGDWFVVLATRADAALGTGDPTGVAGQAARLRRVVSALGASRPVVLLAVGGAGHAARLAADAEASVGHLVTLGTPWTPVAFDTARDGVSADALRLLEALLPAADPAEPDDPDLATGRALVEGLRHAAVQADLEAPRPETAVRPGLAVRAWFGALDRPAVERAVTAVLA